MTEPTPTPPSKPQNLVPDAWERLPDESASAYKAFRFYLGMDSPRVFLASYAAHYHPEWIVDSFLGGPAAGSAEVSPGNGSGIAKRKRSLSADGPKNRQPPRFYLAWVKRFSWEERARAYDDYQEQLHREADEAAIKAAAISSAINWQAEQDRIRRRELDLGHAVLDKAEKLLKDLEMPAGPFAVLTPKWLSAIGNALIRGSELVRNAAEMPAAKSVELKGNRDNPLQHEVTVHETAEHQEFNTLLVVLDALSEIEKEAEAGRAAGGEASADGNEDG